MDRVDTYKLDGKPSEGPASSKTRQRCVLLALGTVIVAVALIVALVVGLSPQAAKAAPAPCTNSGGRLGCSPPVNFTCPGDMVYSCCTGCPKICGEDVDLACPAVCKPAGCVCPCGKEWTDKYGGGCYAEASCPRLG
jgi:hypothetical protein